jgi:hypothetical protein
VISRPSPTSSLITVCIVPGETDICLASTLTGDSC